MSFISFYGHVELVFLLTRMKPLSTIHRQGSDGAEKLPNFLRSSAFFTQWLLFMRLQDSFSMFRSFSTSIKSKAPHSGEGIEKATSEGTHKNIETLFHLLTSFFSVHEKCGRKLEKTHSGLWMEWEILCEWNIFVSRRLPLSHPQQFPHELEKEKIHYTGSSCFLALGESDEIVRINK